MLVHGGVFVGGDRFRALVERFERGTHQFIPADIYRNKNGEPAARCYRFNVCTRLDSVDPEHTTYLRKPSHEGTLYWNDMKEEGGDHVTVRGAKLVFSRERIGSHHLRVNPHIPVFRYVYASDAFGEAAMSEGLTGLNVTPREQA